MMFFVLVGAISFCVFIAMYLDDMLAFEVRRKSWVLPVFIALFGVVFRNVFQLNTFVVVGLLGVLAAALLALRYKKPLKGIMPAAFLVALLFGIEGLTLLSSRVLGYGSDTFQLILLYLAVVFIVFSLSFLLKNFLEKRIWVNTLNHKIIRFLLISAGIALVFILKNFAIEGAHITVGQWAIDFGDIAFMLFFASGAAMFIIILRYVSMETALRSEMLLAEASKKYVSDLEESYRALRTIKHDYVNILTSFKLYIDSKDIEGLTDYYYDELFEMNKDLLRQDQLMGNLQNVRINEIKSILIYKCSVAVQHEIDTDIEVRESIESLGVSTVIVCQMLGILLDNAIEAALDTDDKQLHIAIVKNPGSKVFIIKNSWKKQSVSINKLYELGFSTKGEGRGVGLHTARRYTEKMKGLYLETEITDGYFIQTLTVKDD